MNCWPRGRFCFPEEAAALLHKANQALALANADLQRHQSVIVEAPGGTVQDRRNPCPLLSQADEVNRLNERRLQYRAHRTDIVKRQERIAAGVATRQEKASGLGWSGALEEIAARVPPQGIRTRLNRLLKYAGHSSTRVKLPTSIYASGNKEVAALQASLSRLGADAVNSGLRSAVQGEGTKKLPLSLKDNRSF